MLHQGTKDEPVGPEEIPCNALAHEEAPGASPAPSFWDRGWRSTFRSLRHRSYRLFFFGQLVSLNGTWMQIAALTWLAYHLTGQSKWPALISAAQVLPTFVLGPWGGSLADRCNKRLLLAGTQTLMMSLALLLAGLALSGEIAPWQLLVIGLAGGMVQAIDLPTRMAFVVEMVGREDLINAVALNALLFNSARAVGPAVGGMVLAWLDPGLCFLVNGLSYAAVLLALFQMGPVAGRVNPSAATPRDAGRRWSLLGKSGGARRLVILILLAGTIASCGWPVLSLLPALAEQRLAAQAQGYSFMLFCIGVGALIAALVVARFGAMHRSRRFLMAGVGLVPIGLVGLSLVRSLPLALLCCAILGFGLILFLATGQSLVQLNASDHNRGRIMGTWAMVLSGAVPLGSLLAGLAADRWDVPTVLQLQGLACTTAAACLLALYWIWGRLAKPAM